MKTFFRSQSLLAALAVVIVLLSGPAPGAAQEAPALTMEQAVSMALKHNPDIQIANNQVRSSEIDVKQNGDDFLPSLSLDSSWSATADRKDSTPGDPYQSLSGALSASLNLFNGFKDQASLERSRLNLSADRNTLSRAMQQIAHQTMAAYFQAYTDKESIGVAEKNLEENASQLQEIEAFVNAGTRPVTDLYQQQAETSSAQLDLLNAQRDYTVSRIQLKEIMGMPAYSDFDVTAPEAQANARPGAMDPAALVQSALSRRTDILAQRDAISAQNALIREQSSGYWPALDLFGEVGSSYTETGGGGFGEQFGDDNLNARVGLRLSVPLFDKNQTRSQEAQARISLRNAEIELKKLERQVEAEIGQAAADYQTAVKQVEVTQSRLNYAAQALESNTQRYAVGASTLTELTQARTNYVEAQYEKIQAEVNLRVQALALDLYTGDLNALDFTQEDES